MIDLNRRDGKCVREGCDDSGREVTIEDARLAATLRPGATKVKFRACEEHEPEVRRALIEIVNERQKGYA